MQMCNKDNPRTTTSLVWIDGDGTKSTATAGFITAGILALTEGNCTALWLESFSRLWVVRCSSVHIANTRAAKGIGRPGQLVKPLKSNERI